MIQNYEQLIANGKTPEIRKKRKDALDIILSALEAVNPYTAVSQCFSNHHLQIKNTTIDLKKYKNIYLVGFGKASVGMATAVLDHVTVKESIVVTNDESASSPHNTLQIIVGGHPLPTQSSIEGTQQIIRLLSKTTKDDLILVVISGGGSALLCHPRVSLQDMQQTTDLLLKSGASINELNTVRKHLSHVKGGQLITHTPAHVVSLIISDVVNDPIEFIASGPTAPDTTTYQNAQKILETYGLWNHIPLSVKECIQNGVFQKIPETPKVDNVMFQRVKNHIVASNQHACKQAMKKAEKLGYNPFLLTTSLTGEARKSAQALLDFAEALHSNKGPPAAIAGGETTVTVTGGTGNGGRNQELILSMVQRLQNKSIVALSFATDGVDGKSNAAGAIADGHTLLRAQKQHLDVNSFLHENDSYAFFSKLHDVILTGPTGTNVMDIQVILP